MSVGILLRASMAFTYDVRWGYDFLDHWKYVDWFRWHRELPSLAVTREAYHPPLFYFLAAAACGAGLSMQRLNVLSMVCGSLRLALIWFGLARCSSLSRFARLTALTLAAVLPASVLIDGMASNESLNALLSTLATVLMVRMLLGPERRRRWLAGGVGLVVGLEMLTKISGAVLIAAGGVAALFELLWVAGDGWAGRIRRLSSWAAAFAVMLAVSGWYYAHNQRTHGKAFLSGFDGLDASWYAPIASKPYLERRPASFFYGWTNAITETPYAPTGVVPHSYFWPPLVASTFVDYYSYGFAQRKQPAQIYNGRPVPVGAASLSSYSVAGGLWIAVATVVAWFVAFAVVLRRRDPAMLLLLLLPLLALLGQLHFAVKFAVDSQGPIKGSYLQFAAMPLYALFGLATAWGWRHGRPGKVASCLSLLALALVTSYCVYARLA